MFLLDTDHKGILQRRSEPEYSRLRARMESHPRGGFHVAIVSFDEEVAGWRAYLSRARTAEGVVRAYRMFEQILVDFAAEQVLSYDQRAAGVFQSLRDQHVRIGTMDLRIAAIAIRDDLTLLTRNLVDFRQVPGLRAENWAD